MKIPRINLKQLKARCLADIKDFANEPGFVNVAINGDLALFKDNGASILAVAHLDTVNSTDHFWVTTIGGRQVVFNCQLDDRLGAYLLLDYLPKLGIKYDILLTEGEETASSTAAYFESDRPYNWMFQLDRHGTDVVMYQYESKATREVCVAAGWKIGIGSYSDICDLEHLGIAGFNFGCGYEDNHSDMSHFFMDDTMKSIARFIRFYRANSATRFEHTPTDGYGWYTARHSYGGRDTYDYSTRYGRYRYNYDTSKCDDCLNYFDSLTMRLAGDRLLCPDCFEARADQSGPLFCDGCDVPLSPENANYYSSFVLCDDCYDLTTEPRKSRFCKKCGTRMTDGECPVCSDQYRLTRLCQECGREIRGTYCRHCAE